MLFQHKSARTNLFMASINPQSLIRPLVRALRPYVPGEQPKIKGLIKLNTNENPYPPSPKVLAAVKSAADERLRLYPNPTADALRARLAKFHRCRPENIIVGNGSDELLALATRAFVQPANGAKTSRLESHRPILHAQLFPVSGAGGHPGRIEPRRSFGQRLCPAIPGET